MVDKNNRGSVGLGTAQEGVIDMDERWLIDANELWDFWMYANEPIEPNDVLNSIENCERVDPVRHGKWIATKGFEEFGIFTCSECKTAIMDSVMMSKNYCPECGAKMDLEG